MASIQSSNSAVRRLFLDTSRITNSNEEVQHLVVEGIPHSFLAEPAGNDLLQGVFLLENRCGKRHIFVETPLGRSFLRITGQHDYQEPGRDRLRWVRYRVRVFEKKSRSISFRISFGKSRGALSISSISTTDREGLYPLGAGYYLLVLVPRTGL